MDQLFPSTCNLKPLMDGLRDPIRMEIIFLLAEKNSLNVTDIASRFKVSRPAISHHLKVLKDAGIVSSTKTGQEVIYCLERLQIINGLRQIADNLENCCNGNHPQGK